MTARVDIVTRSRKLSVMGLLLAGTALGAAGCAQQKTEGYYDPPAESTVTDAQYQGSGAGYRSVCLLYTSPSPRDLSTSRMPSSA